jgi:hypothetical protein
VEMDGRDTELLLVGLDEWLLSECEVESLEAFTAEADLRLLLEAAKVG